MSKFEPNAILRGAQLTLVGASRALQNPSLFTSEHYRQAGIAILGGIAIRVLVAIPIIGIQVLLRIIGRFTDLPWDHNVHGGLHFIEHSVLQVPFFLMSLLRYITPTLDNLFMESLNWVDGTYSQKHKNEDPGKLRNAYYPNLSKYDQSTKVDRGNPSQGLQPFLKRFGKKTGLSMAIYLLSFLPYVGPFVLPAASFYTFNQAVGLQPAIVIFGSGLVVPKAYLVSFLQTYFASRGLMRELVRISVHHHGHAINANEIQLEPYFSRIQYSSAEKRRWFRDRSGVLFGFSFAFVILLKVPILGVLIYGLAEASTAYLITKVTEPPPLPSDAAEFRKKDVQWVNKHAFLNLPLDSIDRPLRSLSAQKPQVQQNLAQGRTFA